MLRHRRRDDDRRDRRRCVSPRRYRSTLRACYRAGPRRTRAVGEISEEQRDAVALGRALTIDPGDIDRPAGAADGAEIALIDRDDRVAALARCAEDGSGMQLKPHVVLATARKR
ncbi:hypothetical protein H8R18_05700 [Nanchangia anserum]|nr:hypothetical protein [Nanchangia anserum]QOX81276.1 hypothetical protein H8R18_05700 [Nanchangia anserum]